MSVRRELQDEGVPPAILEAQLRSMPPDAVHGHWSRAFRGPSDVQEIGKMAYDMFLSDNGIFSLRTEYMRRVEEEVIDMCVSLFNAPEDASGTFTSGGSESNYSALHAMREWARERYPHIAAPEVVVPYSAHPTFSKGCQYFGLKLVRTPLGEDFRADVPAMVKAIGAEHDRHRRLRTLLALWVVRSDRGHRRGRDTARSVDARRCVRRRVSRALRGSFGAPTSRLGLSRAGGPVHLGRSA